MEIPDWLSRLSDDALIPTRLVCMATGLTRWGVGKAVQRGRIAPPTGIRDDGCRVWRADALRASLRAWDRENVTRLKITARGPDGDMEFPSLSAAARHYGCSKQLISAKMRLRDIEFRGA